MSNRGRTQSIKRSLAPRKPPLPKNGGFLRGSLSRQSPLFRLRLHSIPIIEFDHNLKQIGVGHEKEETCSLSRCPDRGVRRGRIRYSCPSRSKSLCPERPEAGTTDRQTGDGSASDRIR